MKVRITSLILLALSSVNAPADCYVVGAVHGKSVREGLNFEISEDGLNDSKFIVEYDGPNSRVTPNNMDCDQIGLHTLLCVDAVKEGKSIVETWSVFPDEGRLVHTKSISGFGAFNGGNLFLGEILSRCD